MLQMSLFPYLYNVKKLTLMKKILISSLFLVATLVSTQAFAGTNTSDDIVADPVNGKDQQKSVKKSGGDKYNFTLFNFFGNTSSSKSDTSSTAVTESKEIDGAINP
jgi:hypothetical protein